MTWDELVDDTIEYFKVSGGLLGLYKSCRTIPAVLEYSFARPMRIFSYDYPDSFVAICVAYEGHDTDGGKFNPNRSFYYIDDKVYLVSTDNPNDFCVGEIIDKGIIDDLYIAWLNEDKSELFPKYIKDLFTYYLSQSEG
jgi:hypothetical protein